MSAIDLNGHRLREANVAEVLGLFDSRKGVEVVLAVDTIATEGIDGEVADTE